MKHLDHINENLKTGIKILDNQVIFLLSTNTSCFQIFRVEGKLNHLTAQMGRGFEKLSAPIVCNLVKAQYDIDIKPNALDSAYVVDPEVFSAH